MKAKAALFSVDGANGRALVTAARQIVPAGRRVTERRQLL